MLSPGFIDLVMFLLLAGFGLKGYLTGFIRSVVTIVAVVVAWMGSAIMPDLTSMVLRYSVPLSSPYHHVITRIFTFMLLLIGVNAIGFLLTGLLEKIGLGEVDKAIGALLGLMTGVAIGCLPIAILMANPKVNEIPEVQSYYQTSTFFKAYAPIVKMFRPPARRKYRH